MKVWDRLAAVFLKRAGEAHETGMEQKTNGWRLAIRAHAKDFHAVAQQDETSAAYLAIFAALDFIGDLAKRGRNVA